MQTGTIITLGLYFALMIAIGFYAWRKSTADADDYILGGRQVGPAVTALAAGAADMSGWLMMGLPGALYVTGLAESWIAIGLFIGAFANWIIVAPRLREQTVSVGDALTIPEFLGKKFKDKSNLLRLVSSIVIIIFFTLYSSSGLVAGGKLFQSAFGADYVTGIWITAAVVVAYVVMGGFLAVSLTDFVQGTIMVIALIAVPAIAYFSLGNEQSLTGILNTIDPNLLSLTQGTTVLGVISAAAWGLGYFGQPHIIVRFMGIRSVDDIPTARNIGMAWMGLCMLGALAIGLVGRAWTSANGIALADPETIFVEMAKSLLSPLLYGFVLAAILAAVMSTISAQLLVTASSLTEDVYRLFFNRTLTDTQSVNVGRLFVLLVAAVAIMLAWNPDSSVLGLVSNAWAGFGAAFGPVIILSLTWRKMTRNGALAGMIVGAATVIAWTALGWSSWLYEIVPGFIAAWIAVVAVSLMGKPHEATDAEA
ncbi:sodium/proline symporter PutP [Pseudonocardia sp. TMWB2A]|uniref:sodium/proline symporter PutP n=1 Tax=Pseudonocardia sp. TMWB2A TaxID=687430 RepID=UPI00307F5873